VVLRVRNRWGCNLHDCATWLSVSPPCRLSSSVDRVHMPALMRCLEMNDAIHGTLDTHAVSTPWHGRVVWAVRSLAMVLRFNVFCAPRGLLFCRPSAPSRMRLLLCGP